MKSFLKILRFWFPVLAYSAIIFYVSSLSKIDSPVEIAHLDKFVHFVEYAIFGLLVARAFVHTTPFISLKDVLAWGVTLCFLYGISDEYHQAFVPNREVSLVDLLMDTIGSSLGIMTYFYLKHRSRVNDRAAAKGKN